MKIYELLCDTKIIQVKSSNNVGKYDVILNFWL